MLEGCSDTGVRCGLADLNCESLQVTILGKLTNRTFASFMVESSNDILVRAASLWVSSRLSIQMLYFMFEFQIGHMEHACFCLILAVIVFHIVIYSDRNVTQKL